MIPVDDALRAKLDELAPLLAERFRAQGLPVRTLDPWQVIEWCVHHALTAARRERTKQLYGPGGAGGQGNSQQKDE
ncbi:MAG TPA: hypothetical protein PLB26_06870 [Rubrivivax sp.]|nr:hypothetical protein [Rubrivivax sp.]